MIKFKTKTEFPVPYKREIQQQIIRLIVNNITANLNGAMASGFYYYINSDGEEIMLDAFNTNFKWDLVAIAEQNLPPLESTQSLKSNIFQRVAEFGIMQQMIESGSNYGTLGSDWEVDDEYNRLMRK
ncbi:MAG TPA: hypothetical protein PKV58_08130 [Kaistella sp.]|nr:hypothetical protein [Kaistella sp.]